MDRLPFNTTKCLDVNVRSYRKLAICRFAESLTLSGNVGRQPREKTAHLAHSSYHILVQCSAREQAKMGTRCKEKERRGKGGEEGEVGEMRRGEACTINRSHENCDANGTGSRKVELL